jgi:hypothetical protein
MAWPVSPNTFAAASRALSLCAGTVGSGELSAVAAAVSSVGVGETLADDSAVGSAAVSSADVSVACSATAGSAGVRAAWVGTTSAAADASIASLAIGAFLRWRPLRVLGGVAWAVFFLAANPHRKVVVDTRTPAELLDLIDAKGAEVAASLALLRKLNAH